MLCQCHKIHVLIVYPKLVSISSVHGSGAIPDATTHAHIRRNTERNAATHRLCFVITRSRRCTRHTHPTHNSPGRTRTPRRTLWCTGLPVHHRELQAFILIHEQFFIRQHLQATGATTKIFYRRCHHNTTGQMLWQICHRQ